MELFILIIVPIASGVLPLLSKSVRWGEAVNLCSSVLCTVVGLKVVQMVTVSGTLTAWNGNLRVDALGAIVLGLTCLVWCASSIYAIGFFRRELASASIDARQTRLYYVLTPFFAGGMLITPLVDNLGIMWVAIETSTLASALLVTLYNRRTSFEAGWKYIMLGSVGISLALLGTIITYSSGAKVLEDNAAQGMNWSALAQIADRLDPAAMRLAFVLILIGYGTKAGLAPMHTWKPDAYAEAPVPATAMMGAAFINCAIYAIMRFSVLAEKSLGHAFPSTLLIGFGVFSILLAAPFVLVQRNYRRLLAYSSIDHAGIMVAAVGFGGRWGALGALLHMIFHSALKPLLFFAAGNVQQCYETPYLRKVSGVITRLPCTGVLFLVATLAVTGVPPFGIFQSELTIVAAGIGAGHTAATACLVGGIAVIFCGFLNHAARMSLGNARIDPKPGESPWQKAAMFLTVGTALALSVWIPESLQTLIRQAAIILGGTP